MALYNLSRLESAASNFPSAPPNVTFVLENCPTPEWDPKAFPHDSKDERSGVGSGSGEKPLMHGIGEKMKSWKVEEAHQLSRSTLHLFNRLNPVGASPPAARPWDKTAVRQQPTTAGTGGSREFRRSRHPGRWSLPRFRRSWGYRTLHPASGARGCRAAHGLRSLF